MRLTLKEEFRRTFAHYKAYYNRLKNNKVCIVTVVQSEILLMLIEERHGKNRRQQAKWSIHRNINWKAYEYAISR